MSDNEDITISEEDHKDEKETRTRLYRFICDGLGRIDCPICNKKNVMRHRMKEHMKTDKCMSKQTDIDRKAIIDQINAERKELTIKFNKTVAIYYKIRLTEDEIMALPENVRDRLIPIRSVKK